MFLHELQPLKLVSRSPRRLTLLRQLGMNPIVISESYAEEKNHGGDLRELAVHNAVSKFGGASGKQTGWMLTADTLVGLAGTILGKPTTPEEAHDMLKRLSGNRHQVVTAYCLGVGGEKIPKLVRAVESEVTFRKLSPSEIDQYVASGEPMDKAGAYGIQGEGFHFIKLVRGSASNVMGLPLYETMMDLVRFRIACFACPC